MFFKRITFFLVLAITYNNIKADLQPPDLELLDSSTSNAVKNAAALETLQQAFEERPDDVNSVLKKWIHLYTTQMSGTWYAGIECRTVYTMFDSDYFAFWEHNNDIVFRLFGSF